MLLFARTLIPALPRLSEWRTVALASSAFPASLADLAVDSLHFLPRTDLTTWQGVVGAPLSRMPAFSDYSIMDPSLLVGPLRAGAAAIRYTLDDLWMIVKRQSLSAGKGYGQYNDASAILAARSEFLGPGHCRGCDFIAACAAGGSTGNQTTWRSVATCHHLTKTTQQLAILPASGAPIGPRPAAP